MLYLYQASGKGEITVDEGQDVVIEDPDGKLPPSLVYQIPKLNWPQMARAGSVFVLVLMTVLFLLRT